MQVCGGQRRAERTVTKMLTNIPTSVRREVYRRDNFQCAVCGDPRYLQLHHAVHRSHGGSDFPDNLITLCWRCHAIAHGTRFPDYPDYMDAEWMNQAVTEYLSDWYAENQNEICLRVKSS